MARARRDQQHCQTEARGSPHSPSRLGAANPERPRPTRPPSRKKTRVAAAQSDRQRPPPRLRPTPARPRAGAFRCHSRSDRAVRSTPTAGKGAWGACGVDSPSLPGNRIPAGARGLRGAGRGGRARRPAVARTGGRERGESGRRREGPASGEGRRRGEGGGGRAKGPGGAPGVQPRAPRPSSHRPQAPR